MMFAASPPGTAIAELKNEDPIEPRIKAVAQQLRCPVCQGETIYDSHSTVANQMKDLIREHVSAGRSDAEIRSFFVARYGDFILMEPHARGANALIWAFPAIALLLGSLALFQLLRRRRAHLVTTTASVADTDDLIRRIELLDP
ncbi:MAG: cytochrome c-type biogenesis protein CcmH [Hyphomicrobium sp.]|nr:cytochrome c-type biogenesis protein CcmH [Hyphomicrobium sp.]